MMRFHINTILLLIWCVITIQFQSNSRIFRQNTELNDARKEAEKAEQYRIQQDILSRRRNKNSMEKYMNTVDTRRQEVSKKAKVTNYAKDTANNIDPLQKFKENKANGKVAPLGYEDAPPAKFFSIPLPGNPIGIEKYDEGLRFDLRLPYAERVEFLIQLVLSVLCNCSCVLYLYICLGVFTYAYVCILIVRLLLCAYYLSNCVLFINPVLHVY